MGRRRSFLLFLVVAAILATAVYAVMANAANGPIISSSTIPHTTTLTAGQTASVCGGSNPGRARASVQNTGTASMRCWDPSVSATVGIVLDPPATAGGQGGVWIDETTFDVQCYSAAGTVIFCGEEKQ